MHDLAAHHPVGNGHSFGTCERDTKERSEERSEEIRRDQKRDQRERERPERDPKRKDNQYIGTCYM
jgi:hypothetical protein